MIELFVTGFALSLSLCLDLGIVNVAAFSTAATRGARPAFILGLGSCFGDLFYAMIAMGGVSVLLEFETLRWVLWLGGSAALAYLALRMLLQSLSAAPLQAEGGGMATGGRRPLADFARGFAMAVASPSAILWFASVGGGIIATTAAQATVGVWPFFAGFFIAGLAWSALVALGASQARTAGVGFVRGLAAVSAVLFAALALKVMVDGYRSLM